eukprot:s976_g4.t1
MCSFSRNLGCSLAYHPVALVYNQSKPLVLLVDDEYMMVGRRWNNPGLRKVAEETVLHSARLLRAFGNLDSNLLTTAAGSSHPETAPKSKPKRSRSPVRDTRPPLQRATSRPRSADRRSPLPDYTRESEDSEESEEEEKVEDNCPERARTEKDQKLAEVKVEKHGGERAPPEPTEPPRHKRESREERDHQDRRSERDERRGEHQSRTSKKKKKKKNRGGTKHQRHYREAEDPLRRSHRRLQSGQLELARSAHEGLSRRA